MLDLLMTVVAVVQKTDDPARFIVVTPNRETATLGLKKEFLDPIFVGLDRFFRFLVGFLGGSRPVKMVSRSDITAFH